MTTKKLPFELSEDSATNWLQSLSQENSVNSANQLNKVIKQLRLIKKDDENVVNILILLTPTALFLCSTIESSLLTETNKKSSDKSLKIENLCIQLLRNLSLAFCSFSDKESLSADKQNLALYIALQLIGYTQRLASIYHQYPSTTLWKKSAELYHLSQQRNTYLKEIKHKIKDFKHQLTIEAVLKRNLLFTILTPYLYTSNDIKELFSISELHAQLLNLNTEKPIDAVFSWDPNDETPPYLANNAHQKNESNINIDTSEFLSLIESSAFSSNLAIESLAHIIDQISGYKKIINSFTLTTPVITHFIVGITDITTFLKKSDKLLKIQQLSSLHEDASPIDKMAIEPMEFEKSYLSPAANITPNSIDNLLKDIKAVKILPTSNNEFIIAETNSIDYVIGDIILLCNSDLKPDLGVIRQLKVTNQSGTMHILIEKIPGSPSSHLINSPEIPEKQIIIIQNKNTDSEVFIAPCKLSNGTRITLTSEKSFTLEKLNDYSSFFMRYSIC